MRQAASLLMQVRELDGSSCTDLSSYIKLQKFDIVQKAAILLAGGQSSESYSDLKHPSTLKNIGYEVKHYVEIKEEQAIENAKSDEISDCKYFLKLYRRRWKLLSSSAIKQLEERHYNSHLELPSCDDLKQLTDFIQLMLKEETTIQFKDMVALVQARLLLFNKRRPGELEALR